jgi:hypothetical protein
MGYALLDMGRSTGPQTLSARAQTPPVQHHKNTANKALRRATGGTSISGAIVGLPPIAERVRLFVSYIEKTNEQTIDIPHAASTGRLANRYEIVPRTDLSLPPANACPREA